MNEQLDEILDDLFNANPETSPLGVIDIAKQSLLSLIKEEKIKELELVLDEVNNMPSGAEGYAIPTAMNITKRIKELKESK